MVATDVFDLHELRMATRYQQGNKGKGRGWLGHERREQMPFQVMNGNGWQIARPSKRTGNTSPNKQRAGQAGAGRIRNGVNVCHVELGVIQHLTDEGYHTTNMIT